MIDQSQSRFPGPNWLNTQSIFGPVLIFSKRKLSSWVSAFSRMHLDCLLILSLQLHQKKLIKRLWFIKRLFRLLCQSFCSAEMHPVQINLFDSINISVWLMKEWIWFHVVISRLWGQYSLWGLGVTGALFDHQALSARPWSRETRSIVLRFILSHPNTPIVFRSLPAGLTQDTFHVIYNNLWCLRVILTIIACPAVFIMDQFSWSLWSDSPFLLGIVCWSWVLFTIA